MVSEENMKYLERDRLNLVYQFAVMYRLQQKLKRNQNLILGGNKIVSCKAT